MFAYVSIYNSFGITQRLGIHFLFFFLINLFICFFKKFLAALGLRCCARAFSSCSEQGLLFVAVHRLLIVVASLVAEHEGSRAQAQ